MLPEEVLAQRTSPGTQHGPEARKKPCPILWPHLGQRGWCSCCWPRHGQGVRWAPRPAGASRVQGDLQSTEWVYALLAPRMGTSWAPLHLPRAADPWEGERGSPHSDGSSSAGRGWCPCTHTRPFSHTGTSLRDTLLQARFSFWLPAPLGEQAEAPVQSWLGEGLPGHPPHLSSQGNTQGCSWYPSTAQGTSTQPLGVGMR